ncbi:MAG TPA: hypothetical protein VGJ75_19665 [Dongiaceae bacterium]|jgi:hypothetical protein
MIAPLYAEDGSCDSNINMVLIVNPDWADVVGALGRGVLRPVAGGKGWPAR